jgi:hypothetical protein
VSDPALPTLGAVRDLLTNAEDGARRWGAVTLIRELVVAEIDVEIDKAETEDEGRERECPSDLAGGSTIAVAAELLVSLVDALEEIAAAAVVYRQEAEARLDAAPADVL